MKTSSFAARFPVGILTTLLLASPALAAKGGDDLARIMPVGGGIAVPSVTFEWSAGSALNNPAGFAFNSDPKIALVGATDENDFNPLGFGGGASIGNGSIGGGLAYFGSTGAGSNGRLVGDVGFEIKAIRSAFGAACSMGLSGGVTLSCNRFGYGFNQEGQFRAGAAITTGGPRLGVDAGVAFELGREALIAVDAGIPTGSGQSFHLVPAFGYLGRSIQITAGYGFDLGSGAQPGSLPDEFFGGLGFVIGRSAHLAFYFERFARYQAVVVIRL
jgi:hypothetical protein